ncbi:MAG: methyltransferase domain-containing protein [Candidatus Sulfotelmatobacter sp.]
MDRSPTLNEALRQSRERLYPSLTNPNWLVLRARRRIFADWLAKLPSNTLDVLDVGGRIQPYRDLLKDRLRCYVAIDMELTPLVDILALAESLPLADARFDVVICSQMLQYAADPSLVVAEIHRVLKPGGVLLLSVPCACLADAEEECWRFLPQALRHLLSAFAGVEISAEGSSVTGFFRTVNTCLEIFPRYPAARFLYRYSFAPALNLAGVLAEKISRSGNEQFVVNYSVLAKK